MRFTKRIFATLITTLTCTFSVQADTYPNAPLRLYVSSVPGSAPDTMARVIGDALSKSMGKPVVVENRSGAGGLLMMNALRAAPADGHSIGLAQAAVVVVTPLTYKAANYEIERDFETVGTVGSTPMIFVANKDFPANTLAEAIELAKKEPESVSLGSPSRTAIPALANELLAANSEAPFLQVPFSGTPQGVQATMSGDVQMYSDGVAPLIGLIKSGRLKALAVSADRELPGLEGIPLAKDTVDDLIVYGWFTLHTPKGVPQHILQRLNEELNKALQQPAVLEQFGNMGTYPQISTRVEAVDFVRQQKELFGGVVQAMGLEAE